MGRGSPNRGPRIAILLDHIEAAYHVEMIESAVRTAHRRGARVIIVPGGALTESGTPGRSRGFVYDFLREAQIDGLLVLGGTLSNYCGLDPFDRWVRLLPKVPTIVVGIESPSAPSVVVDNHHGLGALVDHLVEVHGRRHIAFVAGPSESYEAEIRRHAYLDSIERHELGLGDRYIVPGGLGREQGIDAVVHLLEDRRLTAATLDAIVAVNDDVALGVLEELHRRHISVPRQISLVGFDDAPNARSASPPLTTVSQRVYEQGAAAMGRLVDAANGKRQLETKVIRPDVVYRDSCGCRSPMASDTSQRDSSPRDQGQSARLLLSEKSETIALRLTHVAQGRLRGGSGWERRLVDQVVKLLTTGRPYLTHEFEYLARRTGPTGIEVCHEVLTVLRSSCVSAAEFDPDARYQLEDLFQECRLALASVALFTEREHQAMQALHMRVISRACLDRAHGAGLPELAVALEEQLPLLGIRSFVISRGNQDDLEVVARSTRSGYEVGPTVSSSRLGMDDGLENEETVVVLPLSAGGHQVGLASMTWGEADPHLYEQLRDLLGMAMGLQ